jgi:hypothetical protein
LGAPGSLATGATNTSRQLFVSPPTSVSVESKAMTLPPTADAAVPGEIVVVCAGRRC